MEQRIYWMWLLNTTYRTERPSLASSGAQAATAADLLAECLVEAAVPMLVVSTQASEAAPLVAAAKSMLPMFALLIPLSPFPMWSVNLGCTDLE